MLNHHPAPLPLPPHAQIEQIEREIEWRIQNGEEGTVEFLRRQIRFLKAGKVH